MVYMEHDVYDEYLRELLEWTEHVQQVLQTGDADNENDHFRRSEEQHFAESIKELIKEIQETQLSPDKNLNQDGVFGLYQRALKVYESFEETWGEQAIFAAEQPEVQGQTMAAPLINNEQETDSERNEQTALVSGSQPVPIGGHRLPPLPYAYNALEPYISQEIMRLHHRKHHQSYVDGLNRAEKKMAEARRTGNFELIRHWEREAAFNGSGHYLHTIFWNNMSPNGGGEPSGELAKQIKQDFGSFRQFKKHFSEAAKEVEGVGWALLVWSPRSHRLEILAAEKHQHFAQWDVIPLLVLDVWEHAYYLQYKDNRGEYVDQWWNVVNWSDVAARFQEARKLRWMPY
ncbi:superoxide dismutase [Caldalkalibacillus thermarum]|uniref:superoxide dismutase n=1 Tax=Caldalkalibacillus thermarum TaxID=296745 RepID=UPI00166930CA|nr:superoxide dismutase [Caldalkalibacillus thermarum]GGK19717.1 superoxide dismutase [Caldalkalibacillus thermarum]